MKSKKFLVTKGTIYYAKEQKSLVPVDTETNVTLKIATQKTDVIYQLHNVIKDTITLKPDFVTSLNIYIYIYLYI